MRRPAAAPAQTEKTLRSEHLLILPKPTRRYWPNLIPLRLRDRVGNQLFQIGPWAFRVVMLDSVAGKPPQFGDLEARLTVSVLLGPLRQPFE